MSSSDITAAQALLSTKPTGGPELTKWFNDWVALGAAVRGVPNDDGTVIVESGGHEGHNDGERRSSFSAKAHENPVMPPNPGHSRKFYSKVTVLGAGSFGTAMAMSCARNKHNVVLYCRDPDQAAYINEKHANSKYLSQFTLPDNITATTDLAEALANTDLIVHALPCQMSPNFFAANKDLIPPNVCICSTAKGLYVETKQLLGDAIMAALGRPQPLAFLSGPSFAAEIMKGDPTVVVVASKTLYHAVNIQKIMSSACMRIYVSQDIVGVQLGGALKNPLAIGAGLIEGMGLGINTMSAYVTRSCAELQTLAVAMGGDRKTIGGLSGIGDLMLTAFGSLSRNRTCGMRLCKGETLEDILKSCTVEGVPTASVAVYYADACGMECPLFRAVDGILSGKMTPEECKHYLMSRKLGKE